MAGVPGIQINFALVLHGEQDVEIHRPIPVRARVESQGRIAGINDKDKAALIVIEVETKEQGGAPLFTNRFSIFARGERLSGDKNPLHADPAFAKLGGFDKPILHGLRSFGIVCKAVVDAMLRRRCHAGRALPGALRRGALPGRCTSSRASVPRTSTWSSCTTAFRATS